MFDVFVTIDQNLQHQQNLPKFDIAVIVLLAPTNRLVDLKPLVPSLLRQLPTAGIGQATVIDTDIGMHMVLEMLCKLPELDYATISRSGDMLTFPVSFVAELRP